MRHGDRSRYEAREAEMLQTLHTLRIKNVLLKIITLWFSINTMSVSSNLLSYQYMSVFLLVVCFSLFCLLNVSAFEPNPKEGRFFTWIASSKRAVLQPNENPGLNTGPAH